MDIYIEAEVQLTLTLVGRPSVCWAPPVGKERPEPTEEQVLTWFDRMTRIAWPYDQCREFWVCPEHLDAPDACEDCGDFWHYRVELTGIYGRQPL